MFCSIAVGVLSLVVCWSVTSICMMDAKICTWMKCISLSLGSIQHHPTNHMSTYAEVLKPVDMRDSLYHHFSCSLSARYLHTKHTCTHFFLLFPFAFVSLHFNGIPSNGYIVLPWMTLNKKEFANGKEKKNLCRFIIWYKNTYSISFIHTLTVAGSGKNTSVIICEFHLS